MFVRRLVVRRLGSVRGFIAKECYRDPISAVYWMAVTAGQCS